MLRSIPLRLFREWMSFDAIEPTLGPEREDLRHAIMPYVFATAFHGKGGRKPEIGDYMPKFERRTPPPQKDVVAASKHFALQMHAMAQRRKGKR
jgi:hypothetical protein